MTDNREVSYFDYSNFGEDLSEEYFREDESECNFCSSRPTFRDCDDRSEKIYREGCDYTDMSEIEFSNSEMEREFTQFMEERSRKNKYCQPHCQPHCPPQCCRRDDDGLLIIILLFFFCGGGFFCF
ncbi:hypothetical protein [Clostridium sp.]|uniref:hypothetical protein n=1 Tax=Clostridium sp. TaxID=1506 RepID=UPI0032179296